MAQLRRRPGLAKESLDHVARGYDLLPDELDGNGLAEQKVSASIDGAHAAAFEEPVDAVFTIERSTDGLLFRSNGVFEERSVVGTDTGRRLERPPTL